MASPVPARKFVREDFRWDVFLSYRHADKADAGRMAKLLEEMGLKVWWDEREIPPGVPFEDAILDGLKQSWATAVCIGPSTVGGWQEQEVRKAINDQVKTKKPVMPVFLPGVTDPDQVDIGFLESNSRVVFEQSVAEQAGLNRIYWGVTGINPDAPKAAAPVPVRQEKPAVDESLGALAAWLKSGNVTFFVGAGAAAAGPALPPGSWEIARTLLLDAGVIASADIRILPPVDIAATLFAFSKTDPVLEDTVVNLIQSRSQTIPDAHQNLAGLLVRLAKRERPRGRRFEKQLILTSNIDLMVERALLRAGIRFTRVVQHKTQHSLYVTDYHDAGFIPARSDELDDLIINTEAKTMAPETTAGSVLAEPILYKLRGSQDIAGSCALTRPQLLGLARAAIADHLVPAELQKIAANTPIVFLGTGLLDPDFQYSSNTVLFNAWDSDHPKYLVQVAPEQDSEDGYRQMEAGIWDKIKQTAMRRNLTTVEEASDRFLQRLFDRM
jgi:hypothetical protein